MDLNLLIDSESYFQKIREHKNIVIYGAGNKAKITVKLLEQKNIIPVAICDGNKALWGTEFLGKYRIISYEEMKKQFDQYYILICTTINTAVEIIKELREKGETSSLLPLCNLFKVDHHLLETQEVMVNCNRYAEVYNVLEDDLSKQILVETINSKITGNLMPLFERMDGETFFDKDLLGPACHKEVYVDAGAYTGDTLCRFIAYSGGLYEKIIAFEPDEANFDALSKFVRYARLSNVRIENVGLWSNKMNKRLYTISDNYEILYENTNLFVELQDTMDNCRFYQCSKKGLSLNYRELTTDSLDHMLKDECPTLIKINALAADLPILQGCRETLLRCVPKIVMEYGVRPEYLLGEIEFLKELNVGYRFYLRQKNIFGDCKTILYALPNKREDL